MQKKRMKKAGINYGNANTKVYETSKQLVLKVCNKNHDQYKHIKI